jgi:hypothetical protein
MKRQYLYLMRGIIILPWGNIICISLEGWTTSIYHVRKRQPLYFKRWIDNFYIMWVKDNLCTSYWEKTSFISHERDEQPSYLIREKDKRYILWEGWTTFISQVRKRQYLYLIRGMNNLHISCEEKTLSVSHERDEHWTTFKSHVKKDIIRISREE